MVRTGMLSRGCETCRKRRIKCDEKKPECTQCLRTRRKCPGYRDNFDLAWRDQTSVAKKNVERRKRAHKKEEHNYGGPSSAIDVVDFTPILEQSKDFNISSLLPTPSPSSALRGPPEYYALCYFFRRYVLPQRDARARRGFLEYTLPIYSKSEPHSPLQLSIMAIATSMLSASMSEGDDPPFARSFYVGAVSRMKDCISQSRGCANDELLMAAMLLHMYEQLVGRTKEIRSPQAHLDGALALIKHRGIANFKGEVSRGLLYYVRSILVDECLRSFKAMPGGVEVWSEVAQDLDEIPSVRLDAINMDLANIQSEAFQLLQRTELPAGIRCSRLMQIIDYASAIVDRLTAWSQELPPSWIPIRVFGNKCIPPNISATGLYQPHCDVYTSIFIASLWNKQRLSQIRCKSIIISCITQGRITLNITKQREACQLGIQQAVDYICASVPFHIGDRMYSHDKTVNYPNAPGRQVREDHHQTGPAMCGWTLLKPLATLCGLKIDMRDGQKQWIEAQVARVAGIYGIRRGEE